MTTATGAPGRAADRVLARARGYDPLRVLIVVLMALPLAAGWLAGKVCRLIWTVGALVFAAAAEGWSQGWAPGNRP